MHCNQAGLDIIMRFEGFRSEPYQCSAKVWTVGYGSTWDADGNRITAEHPPVTEAEAIALLMQELHATERAVAALTRVELTEDQFSALVSFTYNVGSGNFKSSTLRARLNRRDFDGCSLEFPKWRRAGGVILRGLVRRRVAERELFEA